MNGPTAYNTQLCILLTMGTYVILGQHAYECPPGTYLDIRIGRCDNCNDICQFADIQGTREDCLKHCPDYGRELPPTREPQCPSGQFFDPALSHCDYCFSICDNHEIQKTTQECETKCPEEFKKDQETIRKTVLPKEDVRNTVSPWLIAGISVLVAATLASVLLIVVYRHKLSQSVQRRLPCLQRQYSIAETSPTSSDDDIRLPVEETRQQEQGFTDLRSSRRCSQAEYDT